MTALLEQESALVIQRLHNRYVAGDDVALQLRDQCESALATTLESALAVALASALPRENAELWFVRELHVDFSIDSELKRSGVSEVWAKEIARAAIDAIQSESPDILRFPNRASFLAHFIFDLAQGSAWDRWYYDAFEGLRMLSTSAALTSAVCAAPETGLEALRILSPHPCRVVLKAIAINDARRILSVLAPHPGVATAGDCIRPLLECWNAEIPFQSHDDARRSLQLYIAVTRQEPGLAGEILAGLVVAVCRLHRYLQENASHQWEIIDALRSRNLPALYALLGTAAESITPLFDCHAETLEPLLQILIGETAASPNIKADTRFTAFGGAFLLFALLDEFPFQAATWGWNDLGNISPEAIVRFLVLAKCFGRTRFPGCLRDPLVRDLMRIPPAISEKDMGEWLRQVSHECLLSFLRTNAARHFETGAADAETFVLNQAAHKGAPVTILLDSARAVWLLANRHTRRAESFPLAELHVPRPRQVLCPGSLLGAARGYFPDSIVNQLAADDSPAYSERALARDLRYLEQTPGLSAPRFADLCLCVAAQGVLRRFAARLSGFSNSSLDYLSQNFLECSAAVKETQPQCIVSLSLPPLHLVLSMAGLMRCTCRLSWLEDRPCAIFPEG